MPLNVNTLKSSLEEIMGPKRPKTVSEAADRWSKAIADYSKTGTSPTGGSIATVAASQAALRGALLAAWSNPRSPAPATAAAIGAAMVAFWVPVLFSGAAVGTVLSSVTVGPIVQAGLLGMWPSLMASKAQATAAAAQHASVIDAATKTVVVIDVLPPPAPPVVGPVV